jgi:hypothetical protein
MARCAELRRPPKLRHFSRANGRRTAIQERDRSAALRITDSVACGQRNGGCWATISVASVTGIGCGAVVRRESEPKRIDRRLPGQFETFE